MKHFVQYHNVEKMGSGDSITNFVILTSKSGKDMMGNNVWLICGVGSPRRYSCVCTSSWM